MDTPAPARPSVPDPDIPYRLFRALVRGPAGDDPVVAALALAARAGDAAARNALYTRLEPWLHCLAAPALRAARALPSARIEPDDVRQQIFICYVEVLRDWQPERAPFPLYLGHVLSRRLCRYVWRQAHPRETAVPAAQDGDGGTAASALDAPPPWGAPDGTAAADPARRVAAKALDHALLAGLPPHARRLITLHVIEGRTMAATAVRLGCHERTAWRLYAVTCAVLRARARALGLQRPRT